MDSPSVHCEELSQPPFKPFHPRSRLFQFAFFGKFYHLHCHTFTDLGTLMSVKHISIPSTRIS